MFPDKAKFFQSQNYSDAKDRLCSAVKLDQM
jgi:hypothetical protein